MNQNKAIMTLISGAVAMVEETNEYGGFKILEGNRYINDNAVTRLRMSMEKNYLFSPILVNESYEIIDGQHRFIACKELGLPIRYIQIDGYGLEEVQTLNANSKNWSNRDYIDSFCSRGFPEYIKIKTFMDSYPSFGIQAVIALLSLSGGGDREKARTQRGMHIRVNSLTTGNFKCVDYEKSCELAERILRYSNISDIYKQYSFVCAYLNVNAIKKFSDGVFYEKCLANPSRLVNCASTSQYIALFEEIYNHRNRNKISLKYN